MNAPVVGPGPVPSIDSLVTSSPFLFCGLEKDGTIRVVNPAAEAALGSPRAELEGGNVLELLHPDDRSTMAQAMSDGRETLEGPMILRVGSPGEHRRTLRIWLHCHPEAERILIWGRDMTETRGRISRMPEPGRRSRSGGGRGDPWRRDRARPPRMTMARFDPKDEEPSGSESERESGTEARPDP